MEKINDLVLRIGALEKDKLNTLLVTLLKKGILTVSGIRHLRKTLSDKDIENGNKNSPLFWYIKNANPKVELKTLQEYLDLMLGFNVAVKNKQEVSSKLRNHFYELKKQTSYKLISMGLCKKYMLENREETNETFALLFFDVNGTEYSYHQIYHKQYKKLLSEIPCIGTKQHQHNELTNEKLEDLEEKQNQLFYFFKKNILDPNFKVI